jgi:hypothetical protein
VPGGLPGARLASAYAAMEGGLPAAVVAALPGRVTKADSFGTPVSAVLLGVLAAVLALVVIYAAQLSQLVG